MRTSQKGAAFIASEEGLVPAPYIDKAGVWTWGIGHTGQAGKPYPEAMRRGMPSNVNAVIHEAMRVFDEDLKNYERVVLEKFGDNLEQHEFDGLVSWHYNTGGAYKSSAIKHWRNGDKKQALRVIASWNKVTIGGRKVISDVLDRRRNTEIAMITSGVYPNEPTAIWSVGGNNKVIWTPIDYIEPEDIEAGEETHNAKSLASAIALAITGAITAIWSLAQWLGL